MIVKLREGSFSCGGVVVVVVVVVVEKEESKRVVREAVSGRE
jgi:hypothetical protein